MTFKELRKQSGMTLKQFAEYFEISQRTVESWESDSASGRKCPEYLLKLMEYKLKKEGIIEMNIEYKVERQTLEEALKEDRREPIFAVKTTARTVSGIIEAIEKETDFFYGMDQEEKEEFILHADFHIYKDGVATWEN